VEADENATGSTGKETTDMSISIKRIADAAIEGPIVTSFTKIGYEARRRLDGWTPLDDYHLDGRVIVVTGATSGLGKAAAEQLARCGATLVVVGRTADRNQGVVDELVELTGNDSISQVPADMGDLDQVRRLAERLLAEHDRIDVLVHNAGALTDHRVDAPDGTEATVASQVVGPFLLTTLLLERLAASAPSRVITMSSGGMYATGLTVSRLEMPADRYRGTEQYARAKRAQVTLTEMWAERFGDLGIHFHSLHPGWADTPGVDQSLPTFSKVLGPLLRSPDQGADTLVWLAADDGEPLAANGAFWLDRRPRSIHKLPRTKRSDTPERRRKLWDWVVERSGADPASTAG
jgi:NAD(P)-dependent dehydrogenase (short-subunit alcohol dehydrogenase family)